MLFFPTFSRAGKHLHLENDKLYDEKELLERIAEGSEAAFRQLFTIYRKRIYTYVLKVAGSRETAEDTVQDIFLKLWAARTILPAIDNINAYLHRMAHNHAYNGFRKKAREVLVLEHLKKSEISPEEPGHELLSKEINAYIQSLVDQLTPQQRKVYLLSRERGLKQAEIAQELGISLMVVKKHMVDALRFLREGIGQNYGPYAIAIFVIFELAC